MVIEIEWWKFSVFLFVDNYYEYYATIVYVVIKHDKIDKGCM
jgi:hypothetical protein